MDLKELTKEELIEIIENTEISSGKYGLIWDRDKESEKIITDCEEYIPVLKEIKNKEISNGVSNNILIEGDNFHALSVLNYTHKDKIDIIYIDPPYNTGSKDSKFIYNDKFIDEEDGYKHSKWLNFMECRLKLARKLLKDEGVIFISIDDNEYAQLKLLCDKIFGDTNHLGTIIQNKRNAQNDALDIQKNHEYILAYRKLKRIVNGKVLPTLVNVIKKEKNVFEDEYGYFYKNGGITTGGEGGTLNRRPNLGYTVYYNEITKDFFALDDYDKDLARTSNDESAIYITNNDLIEKGYVAIRPPKKGELLGVWTWKLEKFNNEKKNILISKNKDSYSIVKKAYIDKSEVTKENGVLKYYTDVNSNSKSIIDYSTSVGSTELTKMIGESKSFNNPKNHEMLKYLISLYSNKNAIVLDYFAGSGTTGQSVLELNKEDGGNRKFILCTNNENGICENITYKRLQNTLDGNKKYEGINGNLKYFVTEFVKNTNSKDQLYFDLTEKCIPMLCVKDDCFQIVEQNDEYKIFKNEDGTKYTCIYFSVFGQLEAEFLNKISAIKEFKTVYKFLLGNEMNQNDFKGLSNYRIEPIPAKIVEVYKKIVKMTKER